MTGILAEPHEARPRRPDDVPPPRTAASGALAAAPFGVALALLLIALWSDGAFALRHWGPLAVFIFAALIFAGTSALGSRAAAVLVVAIWAFAGWSVLSALWADSPGRALEGGATNLFYAGLVSLPLLTLPDRVWAIRGARAVGVGLALLVGATTLVCLFGGDEQFLAGRLNDPVEYRNATAALFALAFWPLVCVAAQRGAHPLLRSGAFSGAVMALGLAYLTQSRGVVVGFACGAIVALAFGPDRLRRAWLTLFAAGLLAVASGNLLEPYDVFVETRTTDPAAIDGAMSTLVTLSIAGFFAALLLALFDGGLRISARSERTMRGVAGGALALLSVAALAGGLIAVGNPATFVSDKVDEFKNLDVAAPGETRLGSTGGQRYDLWRIALNDLREHPVTGVGEGSYPTNYYAERRTDRNLSTPHSVAFAALAELGVVGLLLLLAVPLAAFAALAAGWRSASLSERRWGSAMVAGGTVLLGQATVDWLWQIPGLMGLGLLCIAVGVACVSLPAAGGAVVRQRRPWRIAAMVVPLLATVFVSAIYLSDVYTRSARAQRDVSPSEQRADARNAQRLNPYAMAPHYLEAGALEGAGKRSAARAELLDALELEPKNFVTMALIGDLETRAGHRAAARAWYRRALARNPADVGLQQLAGRGTQ